jgi:hypothetical protein
MKRFGSILNLRGFLLIGGLGILEPYSLKIKVILKDSIFQDLIIIRDNYKVCRYQAEILLWLIFIERYKGKGNRNSLLSNNNITWKLLKVLLLTGLL